MAGDVVISAAVEGVIDEAVIRRLLTYVGAIPGDVYGKQGKAFLKQRTAAYNNAARYAPWIILVDLDDEASCAPPLRAAWLPDPAPRLCFRVAVREVEAWLFADRENLADFLAIGRGLLPADPESLQDPKREMVNLARRSRRRAIREDMVPRPEAGRIVGPAYASRLIEFVTSLWHPDHAAGHSESLRRAVECLRRLLASSEATAA